MPMDTISVSNINRIMSKQTAAERLKWAFDTFGDKFCVTSSFGAQSAIMVHLVSEVNPKIPILFINTGYHFPETLEFKDGLQKRFNLNIVDVKPEHTRAEWEAKHGFAYDYNPDMCCMANKVLPLRKELENYDCWATGIRRSQTAFRAESDFLTENKGKRITYKLAPIADWDNETAEGYFKKYNLPKHPLVAKGYRSIGCFPCTKPVQTDGDERSGRWAGKLKTECGIHTFHGQGEGI